MRLLYYFLCTEKHHESSGTILHECCRHKCNAALMTTHISCTHEVIDLSLLYLHTYIASVVSMVTVPFGHSKCALIGVRDCILFL